MKIAYLFGVHGKPKSLKIIIKALDNGKNEFYIHVSKIASVEEFKRELEEFGDRIHWCSKRFYTHWASYTSNQFKMKLLEDALESGIEYDRFVWLSGQDYPIWSNDEMINYYTNNSNIQVISTLNVSKSSDEFQLRRVQRFWYDYEIPRNHFLHRVAWRSGRIISYTLYLMGIRKSKVWKDNGGIEHDYYWGSEFLSINRECARYCLDFYKKNEDMIQRYFGNTLTPVELVLPSLIMLGGFSTIPCSQTTRELIDVSPLTFFDYKDSGIEILDNSRIKEIVNSGRMFIRKIDTNNQKSLELINNLESLKRKKR